jgi:hypothetical protein
MTGKGEVEAIGQKPYIAYACLIAVILILW